MDAYEATRVVFSRIQALDPDNASKIMGLLLFQDHGEKEMIRLAFGPESLLHSLLSKARKDLGFIPSSPAAVPLLPRQNPASRILVPPPPLSVTSPSWAPPPVFSRNSSSNGGVSDEHHSPDNLSPPSPFHGDLIDELQLQDHLAFLNEASSFPLGHKGADFYYPEECRSPSAVADGMLYPYAAPWGGVNGHHLPRRSCSSAASADLCLTSDPAGAWLGWRPCLYYARGYCKNGSSCRFLHGLPDNSPTAAAAASGGSMDALVEQQCQELLLRSKGPRRLPFMAPASAFPYSPTGSLPMSPSARCMSFLQSDSQRAAAAALMLGDDDPHKFMSWSRLERSDYAGMVNPSSRQIYLTFPADSTFREEDVSSYFSIYGPVQDVRIPYQQKRMFGFVTFVYPETVKLILAKGNPHFVCDARVLVKPYKEKGKVSDKYRKQLQSERGDFSPTSLLDAGDPFDLQQLGMAGARMLYSNQEMLLRRKLEEQQHAAELQQAIELQGRRIMGLQLLDLKHQSLSSPTSIIPTIIPPLEAHVDVPNEALPSEDNSKSTASGATNGLSQAAAPGPRDQQLLINKAVNPAADKEESETCPKENGDFQESTGEHNLPDSPFASPTKASTTMGNGVPSSPIRNGSSPTRIPLLPSTSPYNSCFFQMPRFSHHGAIGM